MAPYNKLMQQGLATMSLSSVHTLCVPVDSPSLHQGRLSHSFRHNCRPFRRIMTLLLAVTLLLLPCTRSSYAQEETTGDFEKIARQWIDAFNRGDAHTILSLYAPEAQLMPPSGGYVSGKEIEKYWSQRLTATPGKLSLEEGLVQTSGSLSYQTRIFRLVLPNGLQTKGHILMVLCKKTDGWKICAQAWNTSPETE